MPQPEEGIPLEELAGAIVRAVLSDLHDRRGFDGGFWDEIDRAIQMDIVEELEATVLEVLNGVHR